MRTLLYICVLLLTCLQVNAQTSDTLSVVRRDSLEQYKVVIIRDTVYVPIPEATMPVDSSRIIYTKPVGRYDRGITNYRFIPKNKWIGGVTVSVFNFESDRICVPCR